MGEMYLVLHERNLYILDAGIFIMVQQVSLMMFFLNMEDYNHVLPLAVHLHFLAGQVKGTILKLFYPLSLVVGTLLHA